MLWGRPPQRTSSTQGPTSPQFVKIAVCSQHEVKPKATRSACAQTLRDTFTCLFSYEADFQAGGRSPRSFPGSPSPCGCVCRYVTISSLAFSMDSQFLCASSNTETVHIFKLEHLANR